MKLSFIYCIYNFILLSLLIKPSKIQNILKTYSVYYSTLSEDNIEYFKFNIPDTDSNIIDKKKLIIIKAFINPNSKDFLIEFNLDIFASFHNKYPSNIENSQYYSINKKKNILVINNSYTYNNEKSIYISAKCNFKCNYIIKLYYEDIIENKENSINNYLLSETSTIPIKINLKNQDFNFLNFYSYSVNENLYDLVVILDRNNLNIPVFSYGINGLGAILNKSEYINLLCKDCIIYAIIFGLHNNSNVKFGIRYSNSNLILKENNFDFLYLNNSVYGENCYKYKSYNNYFNSFFVELVFYKLRNSYLVILNRNVYDINNNILYTLTNENKINNQYNNIYITSLNKDDYNVSYEEVDLCIISDNLEENISGFFISSYFLNKKYLNEIDNKAISLSISTQYKGILDNNNSTIIFRFIDSFILDEFNIEIKTINNDNKLSNNIEAHAFFCKTDCNIINYNNYILNNSKIYKSIYNLKDSNYIININKNNKDCFEKNNNLNVCFLFVVLKKNNSININNIINYKLSLTKINNENKVYLNSFPINNNYLMNIDEEFYIIANLSDLTVNNIKNKLIALKIISNIGDIQVFIYNTSSKDKTLDIINNNSNYKSFKSNVLFHQNYLAYTFAENNNNLCDFNCLNLDIMDSYYIVKFKSMSFSNISILFDIYNYIDDYQMNFSNSLLNLNSVVNDYFNFNNNYKIFSIYLQFPFDTKICVNSINYLNNFDIYIYNSKEEIKYDNNKSLSNYILKNNNLENYLIINNLNNNKERKLYLIIKTKNYLKNKNLNLDNYLFSLALYNYDIKNDLIININNNETFSFTSFSNEKFKINYKTSIIKNYRIALDVIKGNLDVGIFIENSNNIIIVKEIINNHSIKGKLVYYINKTKLINIYKESSIIDTKSSNEEELLNSKDYFNIFLRINNNSNVNINFKLLINSDEETPYKSLNTTNNYDVHISSLNISKFYINVNDTTKTSSLKFLVKSGTIVLHAIFLPKSTYFNLNINDYPIPSSENYMYEANIDNDNSIVDFDYDSIYSCGNDCLILISISQGNINNDCFLSYSIKYTINIKTIILDNQITDFVAKDIFKCYVFNANFLNNNNRSFIIYLNTTKGHNNIYINIIKGISDKLSFNNNLEISNISNNYNKMLILSPSNIQIYSNNILENIKFSICIKGIKLLNQYSLSIKSQQYDIEIIHNSLPKTIKTNKDNIYNYFLYILDKSEIKNNSFLFVLLANYYYGNGSIYSKILTIKEFMDTKNTFIDRDADFFATDSNLLITNLKSYKYNKYSYVILIYTKSNSPSFGYVQIANKANTHKKNYLSSGSNNFFYMPPESSAKFNYNISTINKIYVELIKGVNMDIIVNNKDYNINLKDLNNNSCNIDVYLQKNNIKKDFISVNDILNKKYSNIINIKNTSKYNLVFLLKPYKSNFVEQIETNHNYKISIKPNITRNNKNSYSAYFNADYFAKLIDIEITSNNPYVNLSFFLNYYILLYNKNNFNPITYVPNKRFYFIKASNSIVKPNISIRPLIPDWDDLLKVYSINDFKLYYFFTINSNKYTSTNYNNPTTKNSTINQLTNIDFKVNISVEKEYKIDFYAKQSKRKIIKYGKKHIYILLLENNNNNYLFFNPSTCQGILFYRFYISKNKNILKQILKEGYIYSYTSDTILVSLKEYYNNLNDTNNELLLEIEYKKNTLELSEIEYTISYYTSFDNIKMSFKAISKDINMYYINDLNFPNKYNVEWSQIYLENKDSSMLYNKEIVYIGIVINNPNNIIDINSLCYYTNSKYNQQIFSIKVNNNNNKILSKSDSIIKKAIELEDAKNKQFLIIANIQEYDMYFIYNITKFKTNYFYFAIKAVLIIGLLIIFTSLFIIIFFCLINLKRKIIKKNINKKLKTKENSKTKNINFIPSNSLKDSDKLKRNTIELNNKSLSIDNKNISKLDNSSNISSNRYPDVSNLEISSSTNRKLA